MPSGSVAVAVIAIGTPMPETEPVAGLLILTIGAVFELTVMFATDEYVVSVPIRMTACTS